MQDYTYYNEAKGLMEANKLLEALELYNKALMLHKDHPDVLHDRAVCYFKLQRMDDAMVDMNRAAQIQPDYGYRYSSRAYIKSALKDIHGAIADYKLAIELDPEDAISMNNLGLLEEQLGYVQEAKDRFQTADELNKILDERAISPELQKRNSDQSLTVSEKSMPTSNPHLKEMLKAVTTSGGRKDFIAFIRNGFRIKS